MKRKSERINKSNNENMKKKDRQGHVKEIVGCIELREITKQKEKESIGRKRK